MKIIIISLLLIVPLTTIKAANQQVSYGPVKSGETMWKIAKKIRKNKGYSIYQMFLIILAKNPDAFNYQCNINSLQFGALISIPKDLALFKILSKKQARKEVARQNEQWHLFRQKKSKLSCDLSNVIVGVEVPRHIKIKKVIPIKKQKKTQNTPLNTLNNTTIKDKTVVDIKKINLDWLKISKKNLVHWKVIKTNENSGILYIKSLPLISADRKNIFMILPKKSGSYKLATNKFLEILKRNKIFADITLIHFNKDIERGKAALSLAKKAQADLIFSMGSEAAALVSTFFKHESIPVVTSTNKDPVKLGQVEDYELGSGNNIAYTSLNVPLSIQLNYLATFRPDLKVIGLMYNENHAQVMATEVVSTKKELYDVGIRVVDIPVKSRKTAKQELEVLLPKAIAKIKLIDPSLENSLLWITSSTAIFSNLKTINKYAQQIPVLSAIPNAVSEGDDSALLAIGIDRRNNAHLASIYAVDILMGRKLPGELKVGIVTPPDIAINFRVAKKNNIKIPFRFFESASFIYDYDGKPARMFGQRVN